MIPSLVLACALHASYCHPTPAVREFTQAVDAEVPDDRIRALLVVFADHESGIDPNPIPKAWDSRALVSCGYLQQRCALVRTHSVRDQIRAWIYDLERGRFGLPGICGTGPTARRTAIARVREAEGLLDRAAKIAPHLG